MRPEMTRHTCCTEKRLLEPLRSPSPKETCAFRSQWQPGRALRITFAEHHDADLRVERTPSRNPAPWLPVPKAHTVATIIHIPRAQTCTAHQQQGDAIRARAMLT